LWLLVFVLWCRQRNPTPFDIDRACRSIDLRHLWIFSDIFRHDRFGHFPCACFPSIFVCFCQCFISGNQSYFRRLLDQVGVKYRQILRFLLLAELRGVVFSSCYIKRRVWKWRTRRRGTITIIAGFQFFAAAAVLLWDLLCETFFARPSIDSEERRAAHGA
jgi:hypothetical protein